MDDRVEILIRRAAPDDAKIIAHHRRAMFVDLNKADAASLDLMDATFLPFVRRGLAEETYLGWLACTDEGQVVAGAGLIVHEWMAGPHDPTHPRRAYIANVYTELAYRGRGIARRLVTAAVDWCRSHGFRVISLHASDYGAPLYRSMGFEPTNEMQLKLWAYRNKLLKLRPCTPGMHRFQPGTANSQVMKVGVLALQGAFIEHEQVLQRLGVETSQVRLPHQLAGLDGLIIPGGESTTMGQLAVQYDLVEPIRQMAAAGRPVWGTCAGMIFLARQVEHDQPLLGLLDVKVVRNAFGRQVDSFEIDLDVPALYTQAGARHAARPFRAIFIRAPVIESVGAGVEVLARLPAGCQAGRSHLPDQAIVAVRQANLLATAFHPELAGDERFHRYFLSMTIG